MLNILILFLYVVVCYLIVRFTKKYDDIIAIIGSIFSLVGFVKLIQVLYCYNNFWELAGYAIATIAGITLVTILLGFWD